MIKGRNIDQSEFTLLRNMSLGKRAEWFREELNKLNPKNFTSTKVAELLNFSTQGLRNIERGIIKDPGLSIIVKLSELYIIPTDSFLDKFYTNQPSNFTIGVVETNNELSQMDDDDEKWHLCTQILLFKNNKYKLIASETSRKTVSEYTTVALLSALYSQLEAINCQDDNPNKININLEKNPPMMKALQAFNKRNERPWKSKDLLEQFWKELLGYNQEEK